MSLSTFHLNLIYEVNCINKFSVSFYLLYKVFHRRTRFEILICKHPGMFIRNPTVLVGTTSTTNSLAMWWQNLWPLMAANLHDTRLFSFIISGTRPSRALTSQQGRGKHYYVWEVKKSFFIMCGRKLPMSMQLMLDFIWGLLSTIMDRIFPQNPNSPIPLRSTPGTTNSKNTE